MNIVVLEVEALGKDMNLHCLEELGKVTIYERTSNAEVAQRIKEADIVVINRVNMNEETLQEAPSVKLICVTGTGVNMIDFAYCKRRGIEVRNVPDYCTESVAQHTMTMALYLLENLPYYEEIVSRGAYIQGLEQDYSSHAFHELAGKTWGICGLGNIGRKVAKLAEAFSCNVIYYSTSGKNHNEDYQEVDFNTLLEQSDILSVHAPLNESTRGLFGKEAFDKMRKGCIFLNLGRGAIVEEEELLAAIEERKIAGAGLDVLKEEPMNPENSFLKFKDKTRLLITPHIGWSSIEARTRVVKAVYDQIEKFIS
ncbi:D-3-phosphoglycerate dehydrogenase [Lachnospiraceae bacterium KM106-2]|nr:D-3-phosphoglycerate dehydrogenase [Lachnospiraceae bacterium KM106-2]